MRRANILAIALVTTAASSVARPVRAEQPNSKATPLYVLQILTDDADDQAESLTQAIRARVRQAHGWSLAETPQSLETLAIALKCPPRPDVPCLQRIGDQLRADHYVWGSMARKKPGEVTAEVHLWNRGKPEGEVSESYAENLRDPTDESLRTIAARIVDQLTGAAPGGTVVVHAGTGGGSVLVDGVAKGTLSDGVARLDVTEGAHSISVRVPGFEAPALSIRVKAGAEQEVGFALAAAKESSTPASESETTESRLPVREILGYASLAAGVGFLTGATIEGLDWLADKNASDNDRKSIPSTVTDVCANPANPTEQDACNKSKDASSKSTMGWVFLGAGAVFVATGVWLIVTDHTSSEGAAHAASPRRAGRPSVGIVPVIAPHAGALSVEGSF
jgi:hypothetical protein